MNALLPSPDTIPVAWGYFKFLLMLVFPLHLILMNAMVGTAAIAAYACLKKDESLKRLAHELAKALPFLVAFAVNLGVAALLFLAEFHVDVTPFLAGAGIAGLAFALAAQDLLGNFFGGGFSSFLIKRGWRVLTARKFIILVCGIGMTLLIPTVFVSKFAVIIALFAISTFCYAAWSTMALSLPSDLYPSRTVASVSGMSGTGAGIGTILSTFLIGQIADHYSFAPVLVAASLVPLVAAVLVLALVRNTGASGRLINRI